MAKIDAYLVDPPPGKYAAAYFELRERLEARKYLLNERMMRIAASMDFATA